MFGCWPICGERVRVRDISGASVTYFVHENIDKGGFSTIELVSSSKNRQEFVLKRILCHSKSDEVKALDEAFLHLHLPQHRNILSCVGTGLTPLSHHPQGATSQVLMILKYYEKGTLERELARRRKTAEGLSSQIAAKLITGLCRALAVLLNLSSPLSHRDIKPANVLLGPNWCPVLMDFGSCTSAVIEIRNFKDAEKWKDFAAENCSMTYRSPELFQPKVNQSITEKADIWSLGCLLYALLFLESPFDCVHARGDSVALAVCSAKVQFPKDCSSRVTPSMISLIKSMLRLEPSERPSLAQIENALEALEPNIISELDNSVISTQALTT